ncbi:zinc dependent phospholipase C family protein [Candidatus Saccharibacteria bacterium]|nr:zinc dependent phospholipase C family protein [Candidatus Saccharibacteria bacterium]
MPSWNIHLEAGHRLNQKLKFSGQNQKEFLLGCILPDINNGYVNHAKIIKPQEYTHYIHDGESPGNFYTEYKNAINRKTPIFLGYLFHLYADSFFNYRFRKAIDSSQTYGGLSADEQLKLKHHDYWLYDQNFAHTPGIHTSKEAKELAKTSNQIARISIAGEDLEEVERIFESGILRQKSNPPYIFYTEQQLDTILDDMIKSFTKDYLGE